MIRVILHHEFLEFDNGMLLDFISPEMFVALNIHKEFKGFEEFLIYIYICIYLVTRFDKNYTFNPYG